MDHKEQTLAASLDRASWRHGAARPPPLRMRRELEMLCEGVVVDTVEELRWQGTLPAPDGSPWAGCRMPFSVEFPADYPNRPPLICLQGDVLHPNVHTSGHVCLEPVHGWSPAHTVNAYLLTRMLLLGAPEPDSPANPAAAMQHVSDWAPLARSRFLASMQLLFAAHM